MMNSPVVLAVLAHPDDAEFLCAGTLIRLSREKGFNVHIASMAPGDKGSMDLHAEEIAKVRRSEGHAAANLIGGVYHCLEERDLQIFYQNESLIKVVRLLREVRPSIVITHSPSCYLLDHEMTSMLTRAAAFAAPVPNFERDATSTPLSHIPHLYYCDAVDGKDLFGRELLPDFCIDIESAMETKTAMLAAHASQRDWLLKHHGMDQYLVAMHNWGAHRGAQCGVDFAEGFRQHLGHGYPQDNLLGELLGLA